MGHFTIEAAPAAAKAAIVMQVQDAKISGSASLLLGLLPQSHHAPLRIREERERAHAGDLLLFDEDLASRCDDALAIVREVVEVEVEGDVACPGLLEAVVLG